MSYPLEAVYREAAFVAYYLHWPRAEIFGLAHRERRRWVAEISQINDELSRVQEH